MENTWTEVSIKVRTDAVDEVSSFLIGIGCNGVVTGGECVDTFEVEEKGADETLLKVYFKTEEVDEKLHEIHTYLHDTSLIYSLSLQEVRDADWSETWKEFFHPMRVTDRIVVKPTWATYQAQQDDLTIEIDPGMAFGTGSHSTTAMCIRLIEEAVMSGHVSSMLDVGTGSGILSIVTAKMGVARIEAIDTDLSVLRVAYENSAINKVEQFIHFSGTPLDDITEEFDLVVANIMAEPLVQMSGTLIEMMKKQAYLVLSGIILDRKQMVLEAFDRLQFVKDLQEGEWVSLMYRKGSVL